MENLNERIKNSRQLREYYLKDAYRPAYHFIVPEGVHSPVDPNGAIFWRGKYHLCYIYQDDGKHYWGHISSVDLVHWRHHPDALMPNLDEGGVEKGIFSGGAFIDEKNDRVVFSYWGLTDPETSPDGICLAWADDDELDNWHRFDNPVIKSSDGDFGLFRGTDKDGNELIYATADPSQIWVKDGRYYMLTGSLLVLQKVGEAENREEYQGDTLFLFVSDDLKNWEFLHQFYTSKREWTEHREDCMCPDFFPLPTSKEGGNPSDKYMVLFISHCIGCQYYLGEYDQTNDIFLPEQHARMAYPAVDYVTPRFGDANFDEMRWVGGTKNEYFAPESLTDDKGRRIMWTWVIEHRPYEQYLKDSGSSGDLSLPRLLWYDEAKDILRMAPAPELETLRYDARKHADAALNNGSSVVTELNTKQYEFNVTISDISASSVGVKILSDLSGNEETVIYYEKESGSLVLDTTNSQHLEGVPGRIEKFPFVAENGNVTLQIFMDNSIVEVYANETQSIVRHIFGTKNGRNIELFADGGSAKFTDIVTYKMQGSNPF